jgi:hypothetical protein
MASPKPRSKSIRLQPLSSSLAHWRTITDMFLLPILIHPPKSIIMSEPPSWSAKQEDAKSAAKDVAEGTTVEAAGKQSKWGFMTLSGELRNQIYTYVFKHGGPLLVGEIVENGAIGLYRYKGSDIGKCSRRPHFAPRTTSRLLDG